MTSYQKEKEQELDILIKYRRLCKYMQNQCEKECTEESEMLLAMDDFLEITKMFTEFIRKNICSIETWWDIKTLVSDDGFKSIFYDIDKVAELIEHNYERPMKICAGCGEKVYYLSLPRYYHEMRKRYHVPEWVRGECGNEEEYVCPVCGAFDRDRLVILYLKERLKNDKECSLLHIAPSKGIDRFILQNYPNIKYHTCDLNMENVTFPINIENMEEINNESYDFIVCVDVLEHVEKDERAISEFYRILKQGGMALIISPICRAIEKTDEDIEATEAERWRRFGQNDHVRLYSKGDFIKRLGVPGFNVLLKDKSYFGDDLYKENGLLDTSVLYVLEKM